MQCKVCVFGGANLKGQRAKHPYKNIQYIGLYPEDAAVTITVYKYMYKRFLPSATPQPALCSAQPALERPPPGGRSSARASSSCRLWGCGWCCTQTESAPSVGFGLWTTCNTSRENRGGRWMVWHDIWLCVKTHQPCWPLISYQQFVVLDDTEQFGPLAEALLPQQERTNPRILDQIHGRLFWRPLVTHLLVLSILLLFVVGLVWAAHGIWVIICQ